MSESRLRATIYDVAERAGVSIGTVSRTLNAPGKVAELTRRRVLDAVGELGFTPDEVASCRARRGAGRIGVFAPFTSYPSFGERLAGVLAAARGSNIGVVVCDVRSAAESAAALEGLPALRSLDGVMLMSTPISEKAAAALKKGRLPTVLVDGTGFGFPSVTSDDELGGALAAQALLAAGKQHFAFLGHQQLQAALESPSRRRLRGFAAALKASGRDFDPAAAVLTGRDFAAAAAAVGELLASPQPPDGLFAHTDELAAAARLAAIRRGLRVPEDLAIVGFDDSTLAEALELTTIRQPLRETGEWAFRTLLSLIQDPASPVPSVTLPVTLVRRRSA
ncbi:MAG: LacI family transcriptional regulator [Propionibacteriaceae bacterium]|jgi:LacI family transcriptional regulator|nr:LacI family transcriptional regulator [Propionibacteriaceae bacterium]